MPVNANECYAIAPHAELGAIALHIGRGNLGSTATPDANSIGGPQFGDLRMLGYRIVPTVQSNPVTQATEIIYDGIGSLEYALQRSAGVMFGGLYHGFGTGTFSQTGFDITVDRMTGEVVLTSTGQIVWPTGETADVTETLRLTVDGQIKTSCTVTSAMYLPVAYLDMLIVGFDYKRVRPGTAAYIDVSASGVDTDLAANASVTFRNPSTGVIVTQVDDALSASQFVKKTVAARTSDKKLYTLLKSTAAGQAFGTATVNRTITFGKTAPDPVAAFQTIDYTFDGSTLPAAFRLTSSIGTPSSVANGIWAIGPAPTGVSGNQHWCLDIGGTVGKQYRATIYWSATDGGVAHAHGNGQLAVVNTANGASSPAAIASAQPGTFGTPAVMTWTATQATHYLRILQSAAAAGQTRMLNLDRIVIEELV